MLNPKNEGFASAVFPFFSWVIFRFQPFVFRGKKSQGSQEAMIAPRYSADGEVQQARCFCVVVKERNYHMESWTEFK